MSKVFTHITLIFLVLIEKFLSLQDVLGLWIFMVTESRRKSNTKKASQKKSDRVLQVSTKKETSNVSVITKTTTPKVVIQSEKVSNNENVLNEINDKHLLLKLICFVIMCIILLMTFFLSLKTYNAVNELSDYIHWIIIP